MEKVSRQVGGGGGGGWLWAGSRLMEVKEEMRMELDESLLVVVGEGGVLPARKIVMLVGLWGVVDGAWMVSMVRLMLGFWCWFWFCSDMVVCVVSAGMGWVDGEVVVRCLWRRKEVVNRDDDCLVIMLCF